MPQEPIACTLSPSALADRTGALSDLSGRAMLSREETADGQRLVFLDTPEVERELHAAIAAEADCCAFLRMDLRRVEGGLRLDVSGRAEARSIIAELFA